MAMLSLQCIGTRFSLSLSSNSLATGFWLLHPRVFCSLLETASVSLHMYPSGAFTVYRSALRQPYPAVKTTSTPLFDYFIIFIAMTKLASAIKLRAMEKSTNIYPTKLYYDVYYFQGYWFLNIIPKLDKYISVIIYNYYFMTILLLFYNYHLPFQVIERYESLKYLRFQEESIRSVIFWRKIKMKNCFGVGTLEISINLNIRNIYKNQSEILARSRNLKT